MDRPAKGPLIACLASLSLDQLTKAWVRSAIRPGESIALWRFFRLTNVRNAGAAFGVLAGKTAALVTVTLAVSVLVFAFWDRKGRQPACVTYGAAVAAGGALGNLLDRLLTRCVLDFIDVTVWPVFNLADVAIVAGIASIFGGLVFQPKREGNK